MAGRVRRIVDGHGLLCRPAWLRAPRVRGRAEIYADDDGVPQGQSGYDDSGTRQFIVTAPGNANDVSRLGDVLRETQRLGRWTSTQFGGFPTPDGYTVEAFIQASDLGLPAWALVAGGRIGFDLAHDYSVETLGALSLCDDRRGQYFLRIEDPPSGNSYPFRNVRAFCTPTLSP